MPVLEKTQGRAGFLSGGGIARGCRRRRSARFVVESLVDRRAGREAVLELDANRGNRIGTAQNWSAAARQML